MPKGPHETNWSSISEAGPVCLFRGTQMILLCSRTWPSLVTPSITTAHWVGGPSPRRLLLVDIGMCQSSCWGRSLKILAIAEVNMSTSPYPFVWVREEWRIYPKGILNKYKFTLRPSPNAGMGTRSGANPTCSEFPSSEWILGDQCQSQGALRPSPEWTWLLASPQLPRP